MTRLEMNLLLSAINEHSRLPKHPKADCCAQAGAAFRRVQEISKATETAQTASAQRPTRGFPANEKQINYVRVLLEQRDVATYWRERAETFLAADFKAWGEAKTLLNMLTSLPKLARDTTIIRESDNTYSASPRQIEWCKKLVVDKVGGDEFAEWDMERLTAAQARRIIDTLKDAPKLNNTELFAKKHFPAGEGVYRLGEDFYMVQVSYHGTGRLMCKKYSEETGRFDRIGGMGGGKLNADNKLTTEEALVELGRMGELYDNCLACGRILTDSDSKKFRMGPVCRDKAGF